jgi:hypothetical protein
VVFVVDGLRDGPRPCLVTGLKLLHGGQEELATCSFRSERESGKVRILCGFLKNEELGLGSRQALCLQQQIVQIAVAPTTT